MSECPEVENLPLVHFVCVGLNFWLLARPSHCKVICSSLLLFFLIVAEIQCFFCILQNSFAEASMISEYDLGGEWDLFKAPEPIIEEPGIGLDPMTATISMISCGEDVTCSQGLKVADIESFQSEQLLSDVFYDKDLLGKEAIGAPLSEALDIKIPILTMDANQIQENKPIRDITFQKSVSSGCLTSREWMHGTSTKPSFLDFPGMDFGAAYGIRRAYSEGDIKVRDS